MKKNVSLVTGSSGFIGSHVAGELLYQGHEVIGIDDLSGGFQSNHPQGMIFHQGSITDVAFISWLFKTYTFDYVFHLAAYTAEGLSHFTRTANYTTNVLGSVNLINAAVNQGTIKTFVFSSSIAVYGSSTNPLTEDMVPRPEDPYGISKYTTELDLASAHRMFGLNYIIFRPHNVYGVNQNTGDRYRNVIGIFMNQILEGKPMTIFGSGTQTRAFSYIDDVAPIIARSIRYREAFNQVFNIGADQPYTINEVARSVAKAMDVPLHVKHLQARRETVHAFCSHEKATQVFGSLFSRVSLETGLQRMAEWVKSNGPVPHRVYDQIEIQKNMPPVWASQLLNTVAA